MSLVIENGYGIAGAVSYVTVEEADEYHALRATTAWTSSPSSPPAAKEAALIRATAWVDATYRDRFPGKRTFGRGQGLEWPRECAVDASGAELDDQEVPNEVRKAVFEAAVRELVAPGSLNPDVTVAQRIKRERKKIDVIEKEVEYADTGLSAEASRPVLTIIDDIMSSLLARKSGRTQVTLIGRA